MTQNSLEKHLRKEWRDFLLSNPDARRIVARVMQRTGFAESEVLFHMIAAWATHNLAKDQQCAVDGRPLVN